jgi:hypothetical protein
MNSVPFQNAGMRQRVPIIGQQPSPQQQEQMARDQIGQIIGAKASSMYDQLAVAHIATRDEGLGQDVDVVHLRALAKKCLTAAKAFFEGIGAIQYADKSE